jgi:hypothetical protein
MLLGYFLRQVNSSRAGTGKSCLTLCQRQDICSSCILYRVAKKKDVTVTTTTCAPISYEVKLAFEKERQAARDELIRRGLADADPISRSPPARRKRDVSSPLVELGDG